ncbi:MAG TPA: WD40 repeat domain-containing protein [Pyrinomonadaceae bacterium]|jgi:WD40 repeat protein|nr:WD40 repeat domain-containing protein [Pyrinomonadaceae bacterium]
MATPKPQRRSPYKGLIPYTEDDAAFFFGREKETRLIAANLFASSLTLLYGASGVGKSSVLRAGVAHQLREREDLLMIVFNTWQGDAVGDLKLAIAKAAVRSNKELAFTPEPVSLAPGPVSLADYLTSCASQLNQRLMIVLDQFEEYFLYHPQDDDFATELPKAVTQAGTPVSFLISIREDSLAKLDRFEGRIPGLFDNYLRVEHLSRGAAKAAIERPIERYNQLSPEGEPPKSIEPALVEAVLYQVQTGQVFLGEAGRGVIKVESTESQIETPYLQLVMTRLWDEELKAGSSVLRLATLERLGGAQRIVRTHLDEAMSALPKNKQDIAAEVFHYLVTPSGTKIAHTVPDLAEYAELTQAELAPVLEELARGDIRILRGVAPPPDQPSEPRYEIFHDVLASAILDWRRRYTQQQLQEQIRRKERERREREQAETTRRALEKRRRSRLVFLFALLLTAMIGLAGYMFYVQQSMKRAQEEALREQEKTRKIAYSRALARNAVAKLADDLQLSLNLAVAAGDTYPTAEARDALRMTLELVLRIHKDKVNSAVFSPSGKFVVTASSDKTAWVWEASTARFVSELRGHESIVNSAAFSPNGKYIVTASDDHTARIWVTTPRPVQDASQQTMDDPDEEASAYRELAKLCENCRKDSPLSSAAFSPDSKYIVTSGLDGVASIWDWESGRASPVAKLKGHTESVNSAVFSPDGKYVVTASLDGTARIWEAGTGRSLAILSGHQSGLSHARFSPDGKYIVTASYDETARLWDAATGGFVKELRGHSDPLMDASFSPDGKYVVTASLDRTARVWDVSSGEVVSELRQHDDGVRSAVFSADGKYIVTASDDWTARIHACPVCASIEELIALARTRITREPTPEEQREYFREPPLDSSINY